MSGNPTNAALFLKSGKVNSIQTFIDNAKASNEWDRKSVPGAADADASPVVRQGRHIMALREILNLRLMQQHNLPFVGLG